MIIAVKFYTFNFPPLNPMRYKEVTNKVNLF